MNKRTLTALKSSIKRWEENVAAERPWDASTHGGDCALCLLFSPVSADDCGKCPVKLKTGLNNCSMTPWGRANFALGSWSSDECSPKKAAWVKAAKAELRFLKSLLPKARP